MAIFKRAAKQGFLHKTKEAVWPSMGWQRLVHYYRHRIMRQAESTHSIAAGFATGAAISFSPFLGTHFIQALILAHLIRANKLAALAGTMIANPWTFVPIYYLAYHVGVKVFGVFGLTGFELAPDQPGGMGEMLKHPGKFLWPMTVGGYMCGLALWPIFYVCLYRPIEKARHMYSRRKGAGGSA